MKMSDVFKLPMVCEDGDGFIYSNDLRHSIQFDDSDTHMMDHKKAVTRAINNHDRMVDEIAVLKGALVDMVDGYDKYDLVGHTGLGQDRCQEIIDLALNK